MRTTDRDPTDIGLPSIDNFARFRYPSRPPRAPRPRPPEVPPASRPDLHVARIYRQMGWQRNPAKRRPCPYCLARPGAACVTDTEQIMSGVHPAR